MQKNINYNRIFRHCSPLTIVKICTIIFYMKILLTIVVCDINGGKRTESLHDGIEIIYPEDGENEKDFLNRAARLARGKYVLTCVRGFRLYDVQPLLNILDKNPADMVCFVGGCVIKTAIYKGTVKECLDSFSCRALAVMDCKSLLKTVYNPFLFEKEPSEFTDENAAALLACAKQLGAIKGKRPNEIYSYASHMICDRLVVYYLFAIIAIREGKLTVDKFKAFDGKLKAEIVLYLALEKNFTAAKLHKLRDKDFKISRFTVRKFKKLLG